MAVSVILKERRTGTPLPTDMHFLFRLVTVAALEQFIS